MNINFHIERLVLDGLPISRHDGPIVQAAVESELARLLTDAGLSGNLLAGGALANVPANEIQLRNANDPAEMGQRIAHSVYGVLGNE